MHFAYPYILLLFLFIVYFIYKYFFNKKTSSYIAYSNIKPLANKTNILNRDNIINLLRILTLSLIIIAFSRPQIANKTEEVLTEGYEIILCIDTSSSMLAEDFKPNNRLFVAKKVAEDFINKRTHDRIGLVVFSKIAFTQVPLTTDHLALLGLLGKVEIGMTQTDGTAIGNAIAICTRRLQKTEAKSKIAILVTDGANNKGKIDPITAAKAAAALNVKIYTIGIGATGVIPYPVGDRYVNIQSDLDEEMLDEIADTTKAQYFRATDKKSLEEIYNIINKLEPSKIKIKEHLEYQELFIYFLIPALILFILELLLTTILWIKIP
ncbi:MAG: VWA domain-containing protein [Bacteroidetes bacterium]|nr:VWA domain-containing protein [Bacteroidota bacterium]